MIPMDSPTHETDVHDLSLGVIHALRMVDTEALSYVQLRRLYAARREALLDTLGVAGSSPAPPTLRPVGVKSYPVGLFGFPVTVGEM